MKKIIPMLIAIALIFVIGIGYAGSIFMEKYSYSKEYADLNQYFAITGDSDVPMILQEERIPEHALLENGIYYFDFATVHKYFNDRFYIDKGTSQLLYMMPTYINRVVKEATTEETENGTVDLGYPIWIQKGDTIYIAVEYVKKYSNFAYTTYTEPNRMQVYTKWDARTVAEIKKDTAVRYQGGVKSEILTLVQAGDSVQILESMENWTKVKTEDGFVGYVENKRLTEAKTEERIPVITYQEPEYTANSLGKKVNMGWHQVMYTVGAAELSAALENTKGINVISPTWFSLSSEAGDVKSLASTEYVQAAHNKGLQVWALWDNDINKLYGTDTATFLASYEARGTAITKIISLINQYGIDGLNLDFEQIAMESGEDYIQFIRELSVACRRNGTVLSIDNYVPTDYTNHYHRDEQGKIVDYVVIMGYDEHYAGSNEAGSVASINFVESGIEKTLEQGVAKEKIINGIPFYTRIWKTTGGTVTSEAVTMDVADKFVKGRGIVTRWDEETCQNYGELMSGDAYYQVWLEDKDSISTKLNVMERFAIAGVAEWKLGQENASIWDTIGAYMNK